MPVKYLKGVARFWGNVYDKVENEIQYGLKKTNEFIEENVPEPIVNTLDSIADIAQKGYQASPVGKLDEGASAAGDAVENVTNNPMLGMATGMVLGMVDGSPGVTIKGGSARVRPGARGKYITQDEFDIVQPQRIRNARDKVDLESETVENIEAAFPNIPKKALKADKATGYKDALGRKEDAQAAVSSEESNIITPTPDNQYAFPRNTSRAKEIKGKVASENLKLGRAYETLEMHHLFPKGISAAIYNRVRDFIETGDAKLEDLKQMAGKIKKVTGVDTGDLESNILAMRNTPHSTLHGELRYQPSNTFKGEKLEISKEALATQLRKVKNMKELQALIDTFLENDVKPIIDTANIWEKTDDLLKSINPEYTGRARYKPPKK